jgi:hypothetical protein
MFLYVFGTIHVECYNYIFSFVCVSSCLLECDVMIKFFPL